MKYLEQITIGLILLYLVGCFISFDSNPLNWYIFNDPLGRFIFIVCFIFYVISIKVFSKYKS
jgi:hypothetical protein